MIGRRREPGAAAEGEQRYARERDRMVAEQLVKRGIADPLVLEAMRSTPRHLFVDAALRDKAYGDHPLPIGEGQTISQPFMVARMTELLRLTGKEKVLEIGTGSGYQAAVLARLAARVCTVERIPKLAARARGFGNRAQFFHRNAFDADLSKVDVIYMWLWTEVQQMLRAKILAEARPGTRVVTNLWGMGSWEPDETDSNG